MTMQNSKKETSSTNNNNMREYENKNKKQFRIDKTQWRPFNHNQIQYTRVKLK